MAIGASRLRRGPKEKTKQRRAGRHDYDPHEGNRPPVRHAHRAWCRSFVSVFAGFLLVVAARVVVVPSTRLLGAGAGAAVWPTRVTGHGSRSRRHRHRPAAGNGVVLDGGASDAFCAQLRVRTRRVRDDNSRTTHVLEVRRGRVPTGEGAIEACYGAILSVNDDDGAFRIQAITDASSKNDTIWWDDREDRDADSDDKEGAVVEGLFGVYRLPSGRLWVWIAESELVYRAPPLMRGQDRRWFEIRRATQLHLLHQPHGPGGDTSSLAPSLRRAQRLEEARQLSLLRQALKHHDWYFFGGSEPPARNVTGDILAESNDDATIASAFVPDMTVNLQAALLGRVGANQANSSEHGPWWARTSGRSTVRSPVSRFFWNEALLEELVLMREAEADDERRAACEFLLRHAIPVTSAFCGVQRNVSIPNSNSIHSGGAVAATQGLRASAAARYYDHLLITRRSRFRAGTRFTKRGADHTGAVANYAETEQIVLIHDDNDGGGGGGGSDPGLRAICSHVQTRGSIPLRWSSPTDIKTYRPRVRIGTDPIAQARAVRHHVVDQISTYVLPQRIEARAGHVVRTVRHPELVFVNLVDKKSDQGRLGRAFDAVLRSVIDVYAAHDSGVHSIHNTSVLGGSSNASHEGSALPLNFSNVQHVWYDFHAEVKHGRWGRLSQLLAQVRGSLREQGYFRATALGNRSVVDGSLGSSSCLPLVQIERCQSGVVRTNCMDCLDRTNVVQAFQGNPLSLPWQEGEVAHRHLWADNADAISRLYAGTPALKGDFTRTGRRTKRGALDDGMNSLQRYYLNNFQDADRQEGVDLLVGFQQFNIVSNDSDAYSVYDKKEGSSSFLDMSLHEAAQRAVLGLGFDHDAGDETHVRIKAPRLRRSGKFALLSSRAPPLDLRWLPGDLQTQMRGAISPDGTYTPPFMLQTLEARSKLELPWWVTSGSFSDEEDTWAQDQNVVDAEVSANNNPGYLMGAVVAGSQSPFMMATVVLAILVSALPATKAKGFDPCSSIDATSPCTAGSPPTLN